MSSLCSQCFWGQGKNYNCWHPDYGGKKKGSTSLRFKKCKRFKEPQLGGTVKVTRLRHRERVLLSLLGWDWMFAKDLCALHGEMTVSKVCKWLKPLCEYHFVEREQVKMVKNGYRGKRYRYRLTSSVLA